MELPDEPSSVQMNRRRAEVLGCMPLLKMPWRAPDKLGGVAPAVLLPNLPSLSDADLKAHLYGQPLFPRSGRPWAPVGAQRRTQRGGPMRTSATVSSSSFSK